MDTICVLLYGVIFFLLLLLIYVDKILKELREIKNNLTKK